MTSTPPRCQLADLFFRTIAYRCPNRGGVHTHRVLVIVRTLRIETEDGAITAESSVSARSLENRKHGPVVILSLDRRDKHTAQSRR